MHSEHEKKWPSVTQVLSVVDKPFLRLWYGRLGTAECERIKKEAGEFGHRIHELIEQFLQNTSGHINEMLSNREMQMIRTFSSWRDQSRFKPLEIERKVESKEFEYHGTLDSIGTFGSNANTPFILDWKTSSKIDDLYGCQLAAYAHAYKEETGVEILTGGVVRLEKDPTKLKQIEVKTFIDLPRYFKVFGACLTVYNFLHPNKRKRD